jgi:hypothetical protein
MAKRFGALGPLERLCGQPLLALISANKWKQYATLSESRNEFSNYSA